MEQDLTQGSISKVLLRFVLPFLGASILQFLYSVVDMMIVGQFADAAAISAVNTSGQIMQLITGLISGIATGGTVLIGQHVGAKRYPSVSSVAQALLALCLGLGVLLTAFFLAGNHFIISIMQVPAAAVLPAQDYLRITSLGILFIAGYNGISAILRGLGDSPSAAQPSAELPLAWNPLSDFPSTVRAATGAHGLHTHCCRTFRPPW